jgi:hypothetical protein
MLHIDKENLMMCVGGLPPKAYTNELRTTDQEIHYQELRLEFYFLACALNQHFSGEKDENFNSLPESKKEFYYLWRDYYLALYGAIEKNWSLIVNSANSKNVDFSLIARNHGELLIRFLENDCRAMFLICKNNQHYSPSRINKEIRYVKNPKNDFQGNPKLLKIYQQFLKDTKYRENLGDLQKFCLDSMKKAGKRSYGWSAYVDFKRVLGKLESYVLQASHPNKKAKSISWIEGRKYMS